MHIISTFYSAIFDPRETQVARFGNGHLELYHKIITNMFDTVYPSEIKTNRYCVILIRQSESWQEVLNYLNQIVVKNKYQVYQNWAKIWIQSINDLKEIYKNWCENESKNQKAQSKKIIGLILNNMREALDHNLKDFKDYDDKPIAAFLSFLDKNWSNLCMFQEIEEIHMDKKEIHVHLTKAREKNVAQELEQNLDRSFTGFYFPFKIKVKYDFLDNRYLNIVFEESNFQELAQPVLPEAQKTFFLALETFKVKSNKNYYCNSVLALGKGIGGFFVGISENPSHLFRGERSHFTSVHEDMMREIGR